MSFLTSKYIKDGVKKWKKTVIIDIYNLINEVYSGINYTIDV
jgi:hypothetical protein